MTKRASTTAKKSTPSSLAGVVLGLIALFVVLLTEIMGLDPLGLNATPTPSAPPATQVVSVPDSLPGAVTAITVPQGFGAAKGFWEVYFTAPTGSADRSTYTGGIDTRLAAAIASAQRSVDIAAYEFNNPILTQAVIDAHNRGVQVRVVTDNDDGLGDDDATLNQLVDAGIPVVADNRGALMHNKFTIIDGTTVWTGSWNYTVNDTYRNNNNALVLRSQAAVRSYQAEFDEMFLEQQFGPRSPQNNPNHTFTQDGVPVEIYFAPEEDVVPAIAVALNRAQRSIRFLTFSFTLDPIGEVLARKAGDGVEVTGIFETTGSQTQFSEMTMLRCAGLDVRQDGNPFILHHKLFIIDETTVITGSFNISQNATDDNDENLVIITDPDLAAQYLAEFNRRWAESRVPSNVTCS